MDDSVGVAAGVVVAVAVVLPEAVLTVPGGAGGVGLDLGDRVVAVTVAVLVTVSVVVTLAGLVDVAPLEQPATARTAAAARAAPASFPLMRELHPETVVAGVPPAGRR